MLELRNTHADILGNSNTVQQGIDVVIENIKWMQLHQDEIGIWLADNVVVSTIPTTIPTTTTTPSPTTVSSSGTPKMNAALILAVILTGMFFKP